MGETRVRLLVVSVAVLAAPATITHSPSSTRSGYLDDPRLSRVAQFFQSNDSPAADLAEDFLSAADRNGLDWRLLPSICFVETSGGKNCTHNNLFGWDSGRHKFASRRRGIHVVADRLSKSKLYTGKDLDSLLRTYNGEWGYASLVHAVMRSIGPPDLSTLGPAAANLPYSSNWTP